MLFNSLDFLIFFPIVLLIYFIIPKKIRNYWLLIASYYFYMCWNVKYALLIFFSTVFTYLSGIALEKTKTANIKNRLKYKKIIVLLSFLLNFGILFFFKYFNFFIDTVQKIFYTINIEFNLPVFDILLPVGISFYTFQAFSYTMDVFRGEINAEKNFFKYALFISFFPQLVAGPIERSKNLLNQLSESKKFSYERLKEGFLLMLWGFFLKIVLADRIAIFVNTVYGNYSVFGGFYLIVATILFAVQIYCDFYGYSVIAKGSAKILGINLMENFESPYLSKSISEFWRRWHISLTSWFKDYLYIPLGGNKKGKIRKYINKFIVFLVSGLWHGASITYVIWGALNGIFQILGDLLKPLRDKVVNLFKLTRNSIGHKMIQIIFTFTLVDFTWIFFRAPSITDAINIIKSIFSAHNIGILIDKSLYGCGLDGKNFLFMIICIIILIIADLFKIKNIKISDIILKQDYWCRCLIFIFIICFILIFGIWGSNYNPNGFIYFQF